MPIPDVYGHSFQIKALERLLQSGKLPQTLMFAGRSGIGKRLIGLQIARHLQCAAYRNTPTKSADPAIPFGGCRRCPACLLTSAGNHPDITIVEFRDRETWNIEAIRALLYTLNLKAFGGAARVVILNDAAAMNLQTANALLKTLEEPRPDTFFMLVTDSPSKLPPTVASRCHVLHFDQLDPKDIAGIISERSDLFEAFPKDPNAQAAMVTLADGSVENLIQLQNSADLWFELKERIQAIEQGNSAEALALAEQLAKEKDTLRESLGLLRILAHVRLNEEADRRRLACWAIFLSDVLYAEAMIFDRNISPVLVLRKLLLRLTPDAELSGDTTLTHAVEHFSELPL